MKAVSLYWFAAQQQTSTLRRPKNDFFDVKSNANFKEHSVFFLRQQEGARKWLELK